MTRVWWIRAHAKVFDVKQRPTLRPLLFMRKQAKESWGGQADAKGRSQLPAYQAPSLDWNRKTRGSKMNVSKGKKYIDYPINMTNLFELYCFYRRIWRTWQRVSKQTKTRWLLTPGGGGGVEENKEMQSEYIKLLSCKKSVIIIWTLTNDLIKIVT